MVSQEDIERKKEKFDLAPSIHFVAENYGRYQEGLDRFLSRQTTAEAQKIVERVNFNDVQDCMQPQVTPELVRRIIASMPESIAALSYLTDVNYYSCVLVPLFDENGDFSKQVDYVPLKDFPRPADHPTRVLVGVCDGSTIYPSSLPRTLSDNDDAIVMYQTHVFIHEFMHTVESFKRNDDALGSVLLCCDGEQFTLQDTFDGFCNLYSGDERNLVSRYASVYSDKLNGATRAMEIDVFNYSVAEQMCESFVGYVLGIISNDHGCVDFKQGHPEEHYLIDRLCRAEVIKSD